MEAYALTDTGRVRSMNQDYIYASQETIGSLPNLFLVADGMGGHHHESSEDLAIRYSQMRNGSYTGSPWLSVHPK